MTNENVINAFLNGEKAQTPKRLSQNGIKECTLTSNGETLVNYSTVIAKNVQNRIYLNIKKYSSTTSHIQSLIKRLATSKGMTIIEYKEIIESEVK